MPDARKPRKPKAEKVDPVEPVLNSPELNAFMRQHHIFEDGWVSYVQFDSEGTGSVGWVQVDTHSGDYMACKAAWEGFWDQLISEARQDIVAAHMKKRSDPKVEELADG